VDRFGVDRRARQDMVRQGCSRNGGARPALIGTARHGVDWPVWIGSARPGLVRCGRQGWASIGEVANGSEGRGRQGWA